MKANLNNDERACVRNRPSKLIYSLENEGIIESSCGNEHGAEKEIKLAFSPQVLELMFLPHAVGEQLHNQRKISLHFLA